MAYYRRRRVARRSSYRTRRSSYRRPVRRRRVSRRRSGATRLVIQVVGGPGGVAASPVTLGSKAARPLRARY